jgi:hypothetical protein
MQCRKSPRTVPEHRLVGDGISRVDRLGLVADHGHRSRSGYSGPLQIPNGRSTKVMRNLSGDASVPARGKPCSPEIPDGMAIPMEEPRDHHALGDFKLARHRQLALKDGAQLIGQRELTTFSALRLTRLKPQPPIPQVHVMPLAGQ